MATSITPTRESLTLRPANEGGYTVWSELRRDYGDGGRLLYAGTLLEALDFMRKSFEAENNTWGERLSGSIDCLA